MTTFKTAESPYKSDNTASNMCGFTLMNNQVGVVVAQVCDQLPNVKVTPLPSMIRVDAVGRMDVVYDDVSEALLAKWDALPAPREVDVAAAMMHATLHIISRAMFSS